MINLTREMRGGKDYDAEWFRRGRGQGPMANLISQRFQKAAARNGLSSQRPALRTDLFRPRESIGGQFLLEL